MTEYETYQEHIRYTRETESKFMDLYSSGRSFNKKSLKENYVVIKNGCRYVPLQKGNTGFCRYFFL